MYRFIFNPLVNHLRSALLQLRHLGGGISVWSLRPLPAALLQVLRPHPRISKTLHIRIIGKSKMGGGWEYGWLVTHPGQGVHHPHIKTAGIGCGKPHYSECKISSDGKWMGGCLFYSIIWALILTITKKMRQKFCFQYLVCKYIPLYIVSSQFNSWEWSDKVIYCKVHQCENNLWVLLTSKNLRRNGV